MSINGECFCGQVTYKINGELHDGRSCHCSRCRKAFSSQASAYALVIPETFHWLTGESLLSTYQSKGDFGLTFCSQCGSTLCGTYQGAIHGVTLGCVNGDPEVEISMHIYVGSKAKWEIIPAGVRHYEEGPPT